MQNKPAIFNKALVEKRNILNELRSNSMTLQELRFFSIYLSKINARDIATRKVRFPLSDFQKIMEIGTDMNIPHFRLTVRRLLQQIVEVPNENGYGYTAFQLFKECIVEKDDYGEWYVEIDAHDKALPLMFNFKKHYFNYELWNALRLKSSNQIRMYEILKQFEKIGKREISVIDLRTLLGIAPNEYPRWNNFKMRVLDSCQQALAENTDICYTYERGKTGRGGKWQTIIFHIKKNTNYVDQLTLNEFIDLQPEPDVIEATYTELDDEELRIEKYGNEDLAILASAVEDEFTKEEMEQIRRKLRRIQTLKDPMLSGRAAIIWGQAHYLSDKYAALNTESLRKDQDGSEIKNRFKYFLAMLESDVFVPEVLH